MITLLLLCYLDLSVHSLFVFSLQITSMRTACSPPSFELFSQSTGEDTKEYDKGPTRIPSADLVCHQSNMKNTAESATEPESDANKPTPAARSGKDNSNLTDSTSDQNKTKPRVIDLTSDDLKSPSLQKDPKPLLSKSENGGEDQLQKAIKLSEQQLKEDVARRQEQEEEELREALRLSAVESRKVGVSPSAGASANNHQDFTTQSVAVAATSITNALEVMDSDYGNCDDLELAIKQSLETRRAEDWLMQSCSGFYKTLSREEFEQCFIEWFSKQCPNGIQEIEGSSFVKEGNSFNDFRRGIDERDKGSQERAQYGRLEIGALYQILDSMAGIEKDSGLHCDAIGPVKSLVDIGMGACALNLLYFHTSCSISQNYYELQVLDVKSCKQGWSMG
jgi:hypothetical protein